MACSAAAALVTTTSSSSSCCCSASSHGLSRPLRLLTSPARIRLRLSCSRIPAPLDWSAANDAAWDDDEDDHIGFQIQVSKVPGGKQRNRRVVRARVRVNAPLEAVWATLTDYQGLADFIPGLSECRLLHQASGFARLYQVGEQDLALGFKFNAKGTIDCYEGDLLIDSAAATRTRDIAFNMIDGDFNLFHGKWSVQEVDGPPPSVVEASSEEQDQFQFQTTLSYQVELEPKLWVPVRLLEGRICSEIKNNLVSIREEAQRTHLLRLEQQQQQQ